MIINKDTLSAIFAAFNTLFQEAFTAYTPQFQQVAMEVPSTVTEENYAWLGAFPSMREWIGERAFKNLKAGKYSIVNKDFESTVEVDRNDINDDKIGIFKPVFSEMGRAAAAHPDELVFGLLPLGFSALCYDGLPFFGAHKVGKTTVSNMAVPETNPGNPWFLLDTSRAVKPLIFQKRQAAQFVALTNPEAEHVFKTKKFLYGVDSRDNVGFGLWQMAFGSKKALDVTNYGAARAAIGGVKNDAGVPLGLKGNLLVVGPSNEAAARKICYGENLVNAESNPWKGSAEVLVSPWLD
ncbi:MAG: Mu-like prophage major head subunit gpT family protein [Elusimicrobia bacterium]|nr:Mu-like prophage major head subunit gpT family protein [Elusimicrobiota bacterium]